MELVFATLEDAINTDNEVSAACAFEFMFTVVVLYSRNCPVDLR